MARIKDDVAGAGGGRDIETPCRCVSSDEPSVTVAVKHTHAAGRPESEPIAKRPHLGAAFTMGAATGDTHSPGKDQRRYHHHHHHAKVVAASGAASTAPTSISTGSSTFQSGSAKDQGPVQPAGAAAGGSAKPAGGPWRRLGPIIGWARPRSGRSASSLSAGAAQSERTGAESPDALGDGPDGSADDTSAIVSLLTASIFSRVVGQEASGAGAGGAERGDSRGGTVDGTAEGGEQDGGAGEVPRSADPTIAGGAGPEDDLEAAAAEALGALGGRRLPRGEAGCAQAGPGLAHRPPLTPYPSLCDPSLLSSQGSFDPKTYANGVDKATAAAPAAASADSQGSPCQGGSGGAPALDACSMPSIPESSGLREPPPTPSGCSRASSQSAPPPTRSQPATPPTTPACLSPALSLTSPSLAAAAKCSASSPGVAVAAAAALTAGVAASGPRRLLSQASSGASISAAGGSTSGRGTPSNDTPVRQQSAGDAEGDAVDGASPQRSAGVPAPIRGAGATSGDEVGASKDVLRSAINSLQAGGSQKRVRQLADTADVPAGVPGPPPSIAAAAGHLKSHQPHLLAAVLPVALGGPLADAAVSPAATSPISVLAGTGVVPPAAAGAAPARCPPSACGVESFTRIPEDTPVTTGDGSALYPGDAWAEDSLGCSGMREDSVGSASKLPARPPPLRLQLSCGSGTLLMGAGSGNLAFEEAFGVRGGVPLDEMALRAASTPRALPVSRASSCCSSQLERALGDAGGAEQGPAPGRRDAATGGAGAGGRGEGVGLELLGGGGGGGSSGSGGSGCGVSVSPFAEMSKLGQVQEQEREDGQHDSCGAEAWDDASTGGASGRGSQQPDGPCLPPTSPGQYPSCSVPPVPALQPPSACSSSCSRKPHACVTELPAAARRELWEAETDAPVGPRGAAGGGSVDGGSDIARPRSLFGRGARERAPLWGFCGCLAPRVRSGDRRNGGT